MQLRMRLFRTWAMINLPTGSYSLLFSVDTTGTVPRTFALDNIDVTSCDYPSYQLVADYSHLSLSCDFDQLTLCDMTNGDRFTTPTFNFTVVTGDTVPNRDLGPIRDHTNNASTGGFLYWNRQLPFTARDFGRLSTSTTILQNLGMCVRFAYYVKSLAVNKNGTLLSLSVGGCYAQTLWYTSLDDSQGWQTALLPLSAYSCGETLYFGVSQANPIPISVAFDDIDVDQCNTFVPATTTTTTTITTAPSVSTTGVSSVSSTSATTMMTTTTSPPVTSTRSASTTTTTTGKSDARRLFSSQALSLMLICLLSHYFWPLL